MQKSRLVVSKDMAWDIAANHKPKQTLSEQQNTPRMFLFADSFGTFIYIPTAIFPLTCRKLTLLQWIHFLPFSSFILKLESRWFMLL